MTEDTKAAPQEVQAQAAKDTKPSVREAITKRKAKRKNTDKAQKISSPALAREITLNSLQSQRVFDRHFKRVSKALLDLEVVLQVITDKIGERDAISAMEDKISELFEHVNKDLDGEIERCRVLLNDNGIVEMVEYTSPKTISVELTSPQLINFTRMLSQLDELMLLIDTLWLNTILNNRQRLDANFAWQQRLMKLASRIIGNQNRARQAAFRAGLGDKVNELAPEDSQEDDDEELAAAVAEAEAEAEAEEAGAVAV